MSKDKNFERRMIVSKYSNRPPFDLKKPKETYDILDRIKEYPVEGCRNCCMNMTSSKNNVPIPHRIPITKDSEISGASPRKGAISKVLQTFEKLSLFQDLEDPCTTNKDSIQTLYRNTKSCKLGKNIPNHKLMKSLLKNLDSEADSCKKEMPFPSKGRFKNRKSFSKKQLSDKDQTVTPNLSGNSNVLNLFAKCAQANAKPPLVDKKTSTTGLLWPPKSREVLQYSDVVHGYQINNKSFREFADDHHNALRTVREREENLAPQFSSSSFLEEPPTKEVIQKNNVGPARSEKLLKKNYVCMGQLKQRSLEDSTALKKQRYHKNEAVNVRSRRRSNDQIRTCPPQKLRLRERSFVQAQVEKLNKVMNITKGPRSKLSSPPKFDGGLQRKDVEHYAGVGHDGIFLGKERVASNYLELMEKIRNNVPRLQKSDNYESNQTDNEWSDFGSDLNPEHIRFPKETKTAVDQHLSQRRMIIPLSKFTQPHDDFRPAIPQKEDEIYYDYLAGVRSKEKQMNGYMAPSPTQEIRKKPARKSAAAKPTINIPCKKNLLCDKGEQHLGSCGYSTHNRNKII